MLRFSLSIFFLITFTTTAIAAKYQKVIINTKDENEIYIDGEIAFPKDGKYLLERTKKPHTIVAKREGYKDDIICAIPYLANGSSYPSTYHVGMNMKRLPEANDSLKDLRINTVALDLKAETNRRRIFTDYAQYLRKAIRQESVPISEEKEVDYDNTIFAYKVNKFLKEIAFIDTSDNVLNNGFLDGLLTDVLITEFTYHMAPAHSWSNYGGMIYVELKAEWKLMNIYEEELYTFENEMVSGYLAYDSRSDVSKAITEATTDALSNGIIDFINQVEVMEALAKKETKESNAYEPLTLSHQNDFVSSISETVKSSVTIKSKESHGSGFFVSNDGYIITNYHVVVDAEEMEVVLNDESKHPVTIERISKIQDLALLKIDIAGVKPIKIDPNREILIATDIFAVGTPQAEDLSQTVSKGIISAIRKRNKIINYLQIDASINAGNSGGAIVDSDGNLVGVVSSKLFGFGIEGVGFGIPAKEIFNSLNVNQ